MKLHTKDIATKDSDLNWMIAFRSGTVLLALFSSHANFGLGTEVGVRLKVDHLVTFEIERNPDSQPI